MVHYLKYIVIIFGSIGLLVGGFFIYQNKSDLGLAWDYSDVLDYDNLKETCLGIEDNYYYPCLKPRYQKYLSKVSFTGTNMGLRMMFKALDEDKAKNKKFRDVETRNIHYTVNYLEVNNMTMNNAYRRYHGLRSLYGGYLATLKEYYKKAQTFSDNLIAGMESDKGLSSLAPSSETSELKERFAKTRARYYQIKQEAADFIEKEITEIESKI